MLYWITHPHWLLLTIVINAAAILLMSRFLPDFTLGTGEKTGLRYRLKPALLMAALYGVLKLFLGGILGLVALPLVFLTLGLVYVVINAFLLWLSDKLLKDVDIQSFRALGIATLVLTVLDWVQRLSFHA